MSFYFLKRFFVLATLICCLFNLKLIQLASFQYEDDVDDDIDTESTNDVQKQKQSIGEQDQDSDVVFNNNPIKMRSMKKSTSKLNIKLIKLHEYRIEMIFLGVSILLLISYLVGYNKNISLAQRWINQNKQFLASRFDFCGSIDLKYTNFINMDDKKFVIWCTGSKFCKGALLELDLVPRQSFIDLVWMFFLRRQINDTLKITTYLNSDTEIPIMVMGNKQVLANDSLLKAHSQFCKERKTDVLFENKKATPDNFVAISELNEFYSAISKQSFGQLLRKHHQIVRSVLFTDLKYDECEKEFTISELEENDENEISKAKTITIDLQFESGFFKSELCSNTDLRDFFETWTRSIEQISSNGCFISKEGKIKLSKARADIKAKLQRKQHQLRVEKAMQRKDLKIREENEKIMSTCDPILQMKLQAKKEKREQRSAKKKMSKSVKILA